MTTKDQINKLASYLLAEWEGDIGKGDPIHGEGAVDCAIRLLKKVKIEKSLQNKVDMNPSKR
jgi:hypothetical protein